MATRALPHTDAFLRIFCMEENSLVTPRIGNKPRPFVAPHPIYPCIQEYYSGGGSGPGK